MRKATIKKDICDYYHYYCQAVHDSVSNAYKHASVRKYTAEYFIKQEMADRNGYGYKVVFNNCHVFTCGYMYANDNGEEVFVYHTPTYRYEMVIA